MKGNDAFVKHQHGEAWTAIGTAETEYWCAGLGNHMVRIIFNSRDRMCYRHRSFICHQADDILLSTGICLRFTSVIAHGRSCRLGSMVWRYMLSQLYIHVEFNNMATLSNVLECCIQDIGHECLQTVENWQNRTVMDWNQTQPQLTH